MSVSVVPTLDMERAIAASGYDVIVGFDEVGRGSLAGPVMVGAAAIRTCDLSGPSPLAVPDGLLDGRPVKVGAILDGPNDYITKALNTFDAPDVPVPADVATKVKGDRYCATVATAAVIAKVTRDRLMVELGAQPQYEPYEWAHNKGYGSAAHRDAIAEFGPSDLHRLSWHLV